MCSMQAISLDCYTLDSTEIANEFSSGSDAMKGGLSLNSLSFCSRPLSRAIRRLPLEFSPECNSSKNCTPFSEGWWDEKKNILCVVACHIIGNTSSLAGTHVGDCSIRLRLRLPSTWSINSTSSIVVQIWSNKSTNDSGYFNMIKFRNEEDGRVGIQATKYEYSLLNRVKMSCPKHKPVKNKGKRYPDAYSSDMRFDMAIRESNKRVAWGYSSPLAVGDEISTFDQNVSSSIVEAPEVVLNSGGLFNISYKILLWYNSTSNDKNSLLNQSSWSVRISAEGIYDSGAGSLCMVGCRDIHLNSLKPTAHSVDCEIVVKFQLPPLDAKSGIFIKGSIESTCKKSDSLYFKPLELSSAAFYTEAAEKAVWRMDMETIMVLISTTLACVFVGLQLYHVKRHPNHFLLKILTTKTVFANVGWLEVNEIAVRLITMVAFLLQFRLLQLTWSSRKSDESNKGLWIAERKATCVTLPLYAAGLLVALLLKLKKDGDGVPVITPLNQNHSSWENLKSYGGLVLDGFLLPQIILNLFSNMRDNVLSYSGSYFYADPSADFYSTAWDIVIPLGGILFAIIIYLQQRFGAHCILPQRLKGSKLYEKVPVVAESEAEVETTNL
ncbi:hypothetical protein glysoja_007787 [Glycine soja]|nr:hypothetical protein glysoja_007787 [Glycine soja]